MVNMYEIDATTMIVSFVITWAIGLLPPVLIRYTFIKRPLAKWPAIGTCVLFWVINIILFTAMGSKSKTHSALVLIAFVSYLILRQETVTKYEQEKRIISEDVGWDKNSNDPWKGMDIPKQIKNDQSKKLDRGYIPYNFIIGIFLYAYAKASGVIDYLLIWLGKSGSDPLSAGLNTFMTIVLSVGVLSLGYFLSASVVREIHNSKYRTRAKGVLLVLFPIIFIAGGLFITLAIDNQRVSTPISQQLGMKPVISSAESNFASVKLPRGVQLQIPKGWWLLGKNHNRQIQTSVEASLDLSGIGLPDGQQTNLIAANSMPRTTYAAVRIDSTIPPSMSPRELQAATAADLKYIGNELRIGLEKTLPLQNNQLLQFYGVRKDSISGHPALVIEYRRSGPNGPVIVQINWIFTSSQDININLSYRESEAALWKPVVTKIRQSITLTKWP